MRKVLKKVVSDLFNALHESNLSDVKGENDMPEEAVNENSAFGDIANAIKSLGYVDKYLEYIESGDVPEIN